ncbi:MAG: DUF4129 domain-containing protein [Paludibacter sp.]|jgi:cbb3-type cytochrome oxidase subunit 3|nr:DUF4129 domain-containing protein [Paludibacter sp.]
MNNQADTIVYDIQKIVDYQSKQRYDYNSQLNLPDESLVERLLRQFNEWLNNIFNTALDQRITTVVLIILFLLIIAYILYIIFKKHTGIFLRNKKTDGLNYDTIEENIHQIDFEKEIERAVERLDFRFAIRLKYLQTLRYLSDNELILWQIHKTPTEYYYEIGNSEIKQPFRELTTNFLQIRYGNYSASQELFDSMCSLYRQIINYGKETEK